MTFIDIVEWDAGAKQTWITQGVVAHTEAEDGTSQRGNSGSSTEPCATSCTDYICLPMCHVDRGSFENCDGRAVVSRRRVVRTINVGSYQFLGSSIDGVCATYVAQRGDTATLVPLAQATRIGLLSIQPPNAIAA